MRFKLIMSILATCTLLLVIGGCKTTSITEGPSPGVRVERFPNSTAQIRMNSVAILDDSIQKWYVYENSVNGAKEHGKVGKIAVESTGTRRTATNTLEAWALFRNRTDYNLQLQCRVQFFDTVQAPLEGPTAWERVFLPANSVAPFKESSINVHNIGFYYIEVREGK